MIKLIILAVTLITCASGIREIPCEKFDMTSWENLGKLLTCDMEGEKRIDTPYFKISSPRQGNVQAITFGNNKKIDYLPLDTFKTYPNLLVFGAWNCSIKSIHKGNFQYLDRLKIIFLHHNQLETINSDTFEDLLNLEFLSLGKSWSRFFRA